MKRFVPFLIILLSVVIIWPAALLSAAETLIIDGTGDSQVLLRKMAERFEELNPGTKVDVPESIGSGGGIKAIAAGKTDLARTARPLKEKEKNGLTEIMFAKSPVVFAANLSVSMVSGLTSQQVLDIFSGKITNWREVGGPEAKLYAVTRETGDSSRKVLEKTLAGFNGISITAKEFYTTPETAQAIKDHKNTIGYVPLNIAHDYGLHILSIDGKNPQAAEADDYPHTTPFYLIKNENPSEMALKFIDFVKSEEAQKVMAENGAIQAK